MQPTHNTGDGSLCCDPKYKNDVFSDYINEHGERVGDKIFAISKGVPLYLATPLGTLRRYNPLDDSDVQLPGEIPWDVNHPMR